VEEIIEMDRSFWMASGGPSNTSRSGRGRIYSIGNEMQYVGPGNCAAIRRTIDNYISRMISRIVFVKKSARKE
jgi:hypothetical protein